MAQNRRTVGYAVVGLGHFAQQAVLPAFENAKSNSRLVALVSGSDEKADELAARYGARTYGYDQLEECIASPDVDAVYIAVPNHLHAEMTTRAAKAGAHVLCEKPMALTEEDCRRMIDACDDADVRLMIAYRLHFEPANLRAVELVQGGRIGEPKLFTSEFSFQVTPGDIRATGSKGGGTLWDIGVYCINAARYLFRAEPEEVFAFHTAGKDERFRDIEESIACTLRFPDDRLATFALSFGAAPTSSFRIVGTKGDLRMDEAYEYQGTRTQRLTVDEKTDTKEFPETDQIGPELTYFSDCILQDRHPEPDGWEGLADVRIVRALYESACQGRAMKIEPIQRRRRPTGEQEISRPSVEPATMVGVEPPHN